MNEKKKVVNLDMKQYGMFLALIAIYVIFAIMTGGKNLSPGEYQQPYHAERLCGYPGHRYAVVRTDR